jgi:hypothetical protein
VRVRRRAKERLEPLSETVQHFLLTGNYPERSQFELWVEVWLLNDEQKRQRWEEHRDELLAEWGAAHPATRPWAWWRYEALEPRQCVSGAELLLPTLAPGDWQWCWKEDFGIPGFVQCRPDGFDGLPEVESEAAYLDRHRLLSRAERSQLGEDAFDPEPVDPFLIDEGELEEAMARGQARRAAEALSKRTPRNGTTTTNGGKP